MIAQLVNVASPPSKPTIWHSSCPGLSVDEESQVNMNSPPKIVKESQVNMNSPPKVTKKIPLHTLKQPKIEWNKIKQGCKCTNILAEKLVCMYVCMYMFLLSNINYL